MNPVWRHLRERGFGGLDATPIMNFQNAFLVHRGAHTIEEYGGEKPAQLADRIVELLDEDHDHPHSVLDHAQPGVDPHEHYEL